VFASISFSGTPLRLEPFRKNKTPFHTCTTFEKLPPTFL
jgi:hypothetical protein